MEDLPGFTTDEEREQLSQLESQLDWHYRADAAFSRLQERLRREGRKSRAAVLLFVRRVAAIAALLLVTFALTSVPDDRPETISGFVSLRQSQKTMSPEVAIARTMPGDRANTILTIPFEPLARSNPGRLPPGPRVDLQLEVRNGRKKPITLDVGGERTMLRLELRGPRPLTLYGSADPPPFLVPAEVILEPGASYFLPIPHLIGGQRGQLQGVYWTEPGRYTLSVVYRIGLKDEPRDLVVSSPPVIIEVKAP